MATSVFCVASSESKANTIVSNLKAANFADQDISVLMPNTSATSDFASEQGTKAPEGAVVGASTGGIVGGTLGLLAGIGLLAIPGVGPFIAAGPIVASLAGLGIGAAVGGVTGTLVGMGIPEADAKRYEGKLKDGNTLISVHTDDAESVARAKEIFTAAGASDISSGSPKSVSGASPAVHHAHHPSAASPR